MSLDADYEIIDRGAQPRLLYIHTRLPGDVSHVQVDIAVGDDYEATPERESAHYLEHLIASLLRSDETRSDVDAKNRAEALGIESNASTSGVRTSYYMKGASAQLDKMIRMQVGAVAEFSDYYASTRTPEADRKRYPNEALSIQRELRGRLAQDGYAFAQFMNRVLYPGHPRSVSQADDAENVVRLTPELVRSFYARTYTASNVLIVIATPRPDEAGAAAAKRARVLAALDDFRFAESPERAPDYPPFERGVRKRGVMHLGPGTTAQIVFVWPVAARRFEHGIETVLSAVGAVLAGGFSSRLLARLRVKEGLVYSVGVHADLHEHEAGMSTFSIETSVDAANVVRLVDEMLAILDEVARDGPTDAELTQYKLRAATEHEFRLLDRAPTRYVDEYAEQVLFRGTVVVSNTARYAAAAALTAEHVRAVAASVFRGEPLLLYTGSRTSAPELTRALDARALVAAAGPVLSGASATGSPADVAARVARELAL